MRITSEGHITIPQAVRDAAGLTPDAEVDFLVVGDEVRIIRTEPERLAARRARVDEMIAGMRGSAQIKMSTDELMKELRGSWDEEPPGVLD